MLHINIICVGKMKEQYLKDAIAEYAKRLSKYCFLTITELTDEPLPNNLNDAIIQNIKTLESKNILSHVKNSYVICLDLSGKQYSSEDFSAKLETLSFSHSNITFIIGGTLGVSQELKEASNELISFSKMTFPHQLMRVFLLEQLFRAFKISNHETYHR